MILAILIPLAVFAQTSPLSHTDAQAATNALTFLISGPGECLFQTTDIPTSAPSKNMAALWLRSVFHDAGTFDATSLTGGLDASLVLADEINNFEINGGLAPALATRFIPASNPISSADMLALGAIVTVKTCGGPDIPFRTGRASATTPNDLTKLPHDPFGSLDSIKAGFARMGLSPLEMVLVVTGSHSLGGAHAATSPKITTNEFQPFDNTPGILDNDIFKQVLSGNCIIPIDCQFAKDMELRSYMALFSNNQTAFYEQYALALEKLLNLSASNLSDPVTILIQQHADLFNNTASSTGVAQVTKTSGDSRWWNLWFWGLPILLLW